MRGKSLTQAVEKAAEFVTATIQRAVDMEIPLTDGLPFEETLSMLWS